MKMDLRRLFLAAAPKHLARRLAQRIAPCVRDEQPQQGLVGEPGLNLVVVPAPVNINASTYKPMDLNRDWSARFSTLRDKKRLDSSPNGLKCELRRVETVFGDFLADPDSRSFSRFYTTS